jgi:RNA polymerase sigma factor (TIGR02999 family)
VATAVTELLRRLSAGERAAFDELFPVVYNDLRRMARRQLRGERDGHTLNATALVHETYFRLAELEQVAWHDRVHFFAVAARAMRRVLIDYAEARRAQKRGGGVPVVQLDDNLEAPEQRVDQLLALDEALNRLEQHDPRQVRVVECHVFAGMSLEETAAALDISPATVSRDWTLARAWLNRAV